MHVTGWANTKVRVTDTKRRNWPWWDHHHWRWFQRSSGGWCPWSPWRAGQRWSWALPPSAWWSWLGPSRTSAHQTHLQSRSQPETHKNSCALTDAHTHTHKTHTQRDTQRTSATKKIKTTKNRHSEHNNCCFIFWFRRNMSLLQVELYRKGRGIFFLAIWFYFVGNS